MPLQFELTTILLLKGLTDIFINDKKMNYFFLLIMKDKSYLKKIFLRLFLFQMTAENRPFDIHFFLVVFLSF